MMAKQQTELTSWVKTLVYGKDLLFYPIVGLLFLTNAYYIYVLNDLMVL